MVHSSQIFQLPSSCTRSIFPLHLEGSEPWVSKAKSDSIQLVFGLKRATHAESGLATMLQGCCFAIRTCHCLSTVSGEKKCAECAGDSQRVAPDSIACQGCFRQLGQTLQNLLHNLVNIDVVCDNRLRQVAGCSANDTVGAGERWWKGGHRLQLTAQQRRYADRRGEVHQNTVHPTAALSSGKV